MIAPTHVSFGVLFAEFVFTCLDVPPSGAALLAAGIGALLPDVDTPKSSLGRLVALSASIERRFGHRQLTHSALFVGGCAVACAPLLLLRWWPAYLGLLLGIASHLLIDMANHSGVPLLYPYPGRFVFPEPKDARIEVGSKREWVLLAVLLVLVLGFTPVSVVGYKSLFYRLSQNPYWAIEEAKKFASTHDVTMTVQGLWKESQLPVDGSFRLLAIQENGFIAQHAPTPNDLVRGQGRVYFLSHTPFTAVLIHKLKLAIGPKITKALHHRRIDYQLFDEVAIPPDAIASGYLFFEGFEGIQETLYDFTEAEYRTLRVDPRLGHKLLVSYCPSDILARLKGKGLFVSHGDLSITQFVRSP
jgi:membrane-bound metal-dependent hydrolase YbcI (DUF457 family)